MNGKRILFLIILADLAVLGELGELYHCASPIPGCDWGLVKAMGSGTKEQFMLAEFAETGAESAELLTING